MAGTGIGFSGLMSTAHGPPPPPPPPASKVGKKKDMHAPEDGIEGHLDAPQEPHPVFEETCLQQGASEEDPVRQILLERAPNSSNGETKQTASISAVISVSSNPTGTYVAESPAGDTVSRDAGVSKTNIAPSTKNDEVREDDDVADAEGCALDSGSNALPSGAQEHLGDINREGSDGYVSKDSEEAAIPTPPPSAEVLHNETAHHTFMIGVVTREQQQKVLKAEGEIEAEEAAQQQQDSQEHHGANEDILLGDLDQTQTAQQEGKADENFHDGHTQKPSQEQVRMDPKLIVDLTEQPADQQDTETHSLIHLHPGVFNQREQVDGKVDNQEQVGETIKGERIGANILGVICGVVEGPFVTISSSITPASDHESTEPDHELKTPQKIAAMQSFNDAVSLAASSEATAEVERRKEQERDDYDGLEKLNLAGSNGGAAGSNEESWTAAKGNYTTLDSPGSPVLVHDVKGNEVEIFPQSPNATPIPNPFKEAGDTEARLSPRSPNDTFIANPTFMDADSTEAVITSTCNPNEVTGDASHDMSPASPARYGSDLDSKDNYINQASTHDENSYAVQQSLDDGVDSEAEYTNHLDDDDKGGGSENDNLPGSEHDDGKSTPDAPIDTTHSQLDDDEEVEQNLNSPVGVKERRVPEEKTYHNVDNNGGGSKNIANHRLIDYQLKDDDESDKENINPRDY